MTQKYFFASRFRFPFNDESDGTPSKENMSVEWKQWQNKSINQWEGKNKLSAPFTRWVGAEHLNDSPA